jgi:hypothetical protein
MTAPSSVEVREGLVHALEADLIGPFTPGTAEGRPSDEALPLPPSRWYLTGFLAPETARQDEEDPTERDELGAGSDENEEETTGTEPEPKAKHRLPASIGLSVLLPVEAREVTATVTWADYHAEEQTKDSGEGEKAKKRGRARLLWRRVPRDPVSVQLALDGETLGKGVPIAASGGIRLVGRLGAADAPGVPAGTRALSLFVVNGRPSIEKPRGDEAFIFQVGLEVACEQGFVPRPNRRDEHSSDWDDRVSDLQFRDHVELAVGHGVSVEVIAEDGVASAKRVRTTWIPRAEVRRVVTREEPGVITDMELLGELQDGAGARAALTPLASAYAAWIAAQAKIDVGSDKRRETRDALLERAEHARKRMEAGVELLATDPEALAAFKLTNKAMAMAARQRSPERYENDKRPSWRLFQLAFVLLNLRGIAQGGEDRASREARFDRETVDLIFFPTGGGKTEAYLGVIGFTLLLRRMRGQARADRGLGVAVLLRYTLRLLTLDQLSRAATLVCALEKLRRADAKLLGDVRFSVGLWVGRSATANTLTEVGKLITEYKANPTRPSPCPLTHCPWCYKTEKTPKGSEYRRVPLGRDSLSLEPSRSDPTEVRLACENWECPFAARSKEAPGDGLPVVFVDEQVYTELPCFLVATVDKFAMLPWRGETGMLFGRVTARNGRTFYGPLDGALPKGSVPVPGGLRPPELIVQDELHLISGPLGTLVGLYETAIAALSSRKTDRGDPVLPKIIAATATVRRAGRQVQALFGRRDVALFPPPGVNDSETFFASVDRTNPGRLYVGVAGPGRAMKAILLRTYVGLLTGAEKGYDRAGAREQPGDGYMSLVGYFNSLRELGGMRRLVEDEVRGRCKQVEERRPVAGAGADGSHPWAKRRTIALEPVELTSRESTSKIALARARLARTFRDDDAVDVILASNMISVGIDIDRLGLMVIAGQPKTTSEYIQASSRVGREAKWPGVVVTCFNVMKPRDRSHYERFGAYHGAFYRFVEATSVTPFSGPALDRGLAGTLIAMTRLMDPSLTSPTAAMNLPERRALGEAAAEALARRAGDQPGLSADEQTALANKLIDRGRNILDAWDRLVTTARNEGAATRCYSRFDREREGKPLLYTVLDDIQPAPESDEGKFPAPTSMRDVEPSVHLWLETRTLGGRRG